MIELIKLLYVGGFIKTNRVNCLFIKQTNHVRGNTFAAAQRTGLFNQQTNTTNEVQYLNY